MHPIPKYEAEAAIDAANASAAVHVLQHVKIHQQCYSWVQRYLTLPDFLKANRSVKNVPFQ
jgi:hypothetical protein